MFWVKFVEFTADRVGSESGCATPGILSCGAPTPTLQKQRCCLSFGRNCIIFAPANADSFSVASRQLMGTAAFQMESTAPGMA